MRYKVILDKKCNQAHPCRRGQKIGAKVWYSIFKNVNNAFLCMAEFNGEMPCRRYFSDYSKSKCACRAAIKEVI